MALCLMAFRPAQRSTDQLSRKPINAALKLAGCVHHAHGLGQPLKAGRVFRHAAVIGEQTGANQRKYRRISGRAL